ncbi:MAG: hypothetical protein VW270_00425 [Candidatus Poseidoniales archaeon]
MLGFKDFLFGSNDTEELTEADEGVSGFNSESYYLYFVIYPAPAGSPNEECMYVGIKHANAQSFPADSFWGGLRYSPERGYTFKKGTPFFEKSLAKITQQGEFDIVGPTSGMYMTSASVNKNENSLCRAYVRGLHQNDLAYHPLILNSGTRGYINNVARKMYEEGRGEKYNKSLEDTYEELAKNFNKKKITLSGDEPDEKETKEKASQETSKEKSDQKAKEENQKENKKEVTNEDYLVEFGTGYSVSLPIDNQGRSIPYMQMLNKYKAYKMFVIKDMDLYLDTLREIEKEVNSENSKLSDQEKEQVRQRTKDEESGKNKIERIDKVAKGAAEKLWPAIEEFYDTVSKEAPPTELRSEGAYLNFLMEMTEKNPTTLTIGTEEHFFSHQLHDKGIKYQGKATANFFQDDVIIKNFYLPQDKIGEKTLSELLAYLKINKFDGVKREPRNQKMSAFKNYKATAENLKVRPNEAYLSYTERAFLSFTPYEEMQRDYGIGDEEDTVYPPLYNEHGGSKNLLKRFLETGEGKEELKRYIEEIEIPIRYKKATGDIIGELFLFYKIQGKKFFTVAQKGNRLVDVPIDDQFREEIREELKIDKRKWDIRHERRGLFTLYHLLSKLGYKVRYKQKLKDFITNNNLEHLVKDSIEAREEAQKENSKKKKEADRNFLDQEEKERKIRKSIKDDHQSFSELFGSVLNEWSGQPEPELIEEGWVDVWKKISRKLKSWFTKSKAHQDDKDAVALAVSILTGDLKKYGNIKTFFISHGDGHEQKVSIEKVQDLISLNHITKGYKKEKSKSKNKTVSAKAKLAQGISNAVDSILGGPKLQLASTEEEVSENQELLIENKKEGMKSFSEFITEDEREAKEIFSNIRNIIDECDDYKLKQMYTLLLKLLETDAPITDSGSATKNQKQIEKLSKEIVDYSERKYKNDQMKKNLRVLRFAKDVKPIAKKDFKIKRPILN